MTHPYREVVLTRVAKLMDLRWLDILGLVIALAGVIVLAWGLIVSKKQALRIGVSRLADDDDEINVNLPQVRHQLRQSRYALIGVILLIIGFSLQIAAHVLVMISNNP